MENKEIKKTENKASRFTEMVLKNYNETTPNITDQMSSFHKRLCQNYFIKLDMSLSKAEEKRLSVDEKKRDKLPITWDNVELKELALNVVAFSRIGLDPLQDNHINMIPYKNSKTNKYDIGFIPGYKGLEIKAKNYGIDVPDMVIVELVYSNDKFKPIKRSVKNPVEYYEFEISENPFDRGEIIGGFYYYQYNENPQNNILRLMTIKDILKRKPKYAAAEFWGGTKDVWQDGKKTGKKEIVEGWYDEMCFKTISRAAYNNITIDSRKIDDDFVRLLEISKEEFSETPTAIDSQIKQLPENKPKQETDPVKKQDTTKNDNSDIPTEPNF